MESLKIVEKDLVKKYYKVVSKWVNGVLVSAFIEDRAGVEYIPGAWVHAPSWLARKGYHLFVFDDIIRAKDFASLNVHITKEWNLIVMLVYECEVRGVYPSLPQTLNVEKLCGGKIEGVDMEFSPGTAMVREVKLLKEVKN